MHPLHDNDLDRISREAADRFEVDSGASGWAHLEKRLDEELPQKKKKRRFLFWLFFITATTGGALTGLLIYQPITPLAKNVPGVHTQADKTTIQQNDQATPNQDAIPPAPSSSIPVGDHAPAASTSQSKANTTGSTQPAPANSQASTPDKNSSPPIAGPGNVKKQKPTKSPGVNSAPLTLNYATIPPLSAGNEKVRSTRNSRGKQGKQQNITSYQYNQSGKPVQDNAVAADAQAPTVDRSTTSEPVDVNKLAATTPLANDPQATDKPDNKLQVTPVDSVKDQAPQPVKKDRKKDDIKQPLEIGLVAGPDMSAVSFGPLYKTGYIFGLQLGYRFSDRWSVNTGVLYTKKYYQADSQYFHYKSPSGGNWPLDNVKGNCVMWEIPLNARYDLSFNDKRRWFVSTGLSTYLMDKENYTLNYVSWSGNPYPRPLNTDSNSNYLFSIWNLSVGFERSLGRNFSIQAEPYLRVPLKGLGTGSMRMNSYGVFFTLKYKPSFLTKKSDNRK